MHAKHYLKKTAGLVIKVLSFPFWLIFLAAGPVFGKRKAFASVMQGVSLFPGVTGEWLRKGVLQWITRKKLDNCCISFGCLFSDPDVTIGNGVYLGSRCDIGNATIGNDCVIGSAVHIMSGLRQHAFDRTDIPIRDQKNLFEKVTIGQDVWIGNAAVIAADIGQGCVIGAGSVVIKPVPDYATVAGNPARVIGNRKPDSIKN